MFEKQESKDKYLLYMHAGSGNHGCEAIVRSLCQILDKSEKTDTSSQNDERKNIDLLSFKPTEDETVNLEDVCNILPVEHPEARFVSKLWYYMLRKLTGNADVQMKAAFKAAIPFSQYSQAISIGGDNYCYDNMLFWLGSSNAMLARKGVPTSLVGCSIEPELLWNSSIVGDMKNYRTIIARETRTYEALREALYVDEEGICPESGTRIYLIPDPAFVLQPKECELPDGFKLDGEGTIGINVSPMILSYEREEAPGITLENYKNLIRTILETTESSIALIPHVVTPSSDDRKPLKELYDMFEGNSRIILVEDHTAEELKYIISKCRLLITARTHASIAAYSTMVPTLVVGYSVKAMGIAKDLFGSTDGYVLPVQELTKEDDLAKAYLQLEKTASEQKAFLEKKIPAVKEQVMKIAELV